MFWGGVDEEACVLMIMLQVVEEERLDLINEGLVEEVRSCRGLCTDRGLWMCCGV